MIAPLLMIVALAGPVAPSEPNYSVEYWRWGEMQAQIYSGRALTDFTVVTLFKADSRHHGYLLAKRLNRLLAPDRETVTWADARNCPALAALPESMRSLTDMKLGEEAPLSRATPDGGTEIVVTADGPTYLVEAPGEYSWNAGAKVRLEASLGPVAEWVQARLEALSSCWSAKAPDALPKPWNGGEWVWRASRGDRP